MVTTRGRLRPYVRGGAGGVHSGEKAWWAPRPLRTLPDRFGLSEADDDPTRTCPLSPHSSVQVPSAAAADRLCSGWTPVKGPAARAFRRGLRSGPARPLWHDDGMPRIRLSTTVDAELLEHARSVRSGTTDAALVDEALRALLARHRSAEVDASYAAYDEHPLDEPDEWGDLASFRRAAAAS